jgi:tRNA (guanine-N7-)-methyltransferase
VGHPRGTKPTDRPHFYGRRSGHTLGPQRRARLEAMLARFGITATDMPVGDPADLFPAGTPVWLEIGFGAGEHLAAQAAAHPDVGFLGCEPFRNGVATLARLIDEAGLSNIRVFHEDVRLLLPTLAPAVFDRVFLLFPDPWPKTRHHRRRFVNQENLDHLARVMRDGAELRFATDHADYCRWSLARIRAHGAFEWTARRAADWRERPADATETRFEGKALEAGRQPVYLRFLRRPRPAQGA